MTKITDYFTGQIYKLDATPIDVIVTVLRRHGALLVRPLMRIVAGDFRKCTLADKIDQNGVRK